MAYGDSVIVGDFFYMEDEQGKMIKGGLQPSDPATFLTIEVNVSNIAVSSGEFSITTAGGLTIGETYEVKQIAGPYTGKGTLADECLDMVTCIAVATTTTILTVYWSSKSPIIGNIKFKYKI